MLRGQRVSDADNFRYSEQNKGNKGSVVWQKRFSLLHLVFNPDATTKRPVTAGPHMAAMRVAIKRVIIYNADALFHVL